MTTVAIDTLFADLQNIAASIGADSAHDLIREIRRTSSSPKIRILIVGSSRSGRFSVVNAMMGQPNLLPVSLLPKTKGLVSLSYGDQLAEAEYEDGCNVALSEKQWRQLLVHQDSSISQSCMHISSPSPLLMVADLWISSIEDMQSPDRQKSLLGGMDYIVVVLDATAVLSLDETVFLSSVVYPNFGFERVTVLLNKIDRIPDDERHEIEGNVNKFFSSLRQQPQIIPVSAKQALNELASDSEGDQAAILRSLIRDIAKNPYDTKKRSLRGAVSLCIDEITRYIREESDLQSLKKEEALRLKENLVTENAAIQNEIERAHEHIEGSINGLIKERFLREIDLFGRAIDTGLPDEIRSIDDPDEVKQHISGYIEHLWRDFFEYRFPKAEEAIRVEMLAIQRRVPDTIREASGVSVEAYPGLFQDLNINNLNARPWLFHRRSKNEIKDITTAYTLGGLVIISFFPPLFMLGVYTIFFAQIDRIKYRKSFKNSELEACIGAASQAGRELTLKVRRQAEQQFEECTPRCKDFIEELYKEMVDYFQQILSEHEENRQKRETDIAMFAEVLDVQIPRLMKESSSIFGDVDGAGDGSEVII